MLYEHRWGTSHSRFRHETQRRFLEVVQPIRELTGTTGQTPPVKRRRCALPARENSNPARKRSGSCHSLNRAKQGKGWRTPLGTTVKAAWGASSAERRCHGASSKCQRNWLTTRKRKIHSRKAALITGQRVRRTKPTSRKIRLKPKDNTAKARKLLSQLAVTAAKNSADRPRAPSSGTSRD